MSSQREIFRSLLINYYQRYAPSDPRLLRLLDDDDDLDPLAIYAELGSPEPLTSISSTRNMDGNAGAYMSGRQTHHGQNMNHLMTDPSGLVNQFNSMTVGSLGMQSSGPMMAPGAFMMNTDGQYVLAPMPAQHMNMGNANDSLYQNFTMPPNGYATPFVGVQLPVMPFTPGRVAPVGPRMERGHSDVPGLDNRRGSYSTTESTPTTPFYGNAQRDGTRVASLDRSAYTTPSPQQLSMPSLHTEGSKASISSAAERTLDELVNKDPPIPKAVPAVFTPPAQMKSVDQSLENRISGNRNVYIRGLHPTTDDELLFHFASRFGPVETSKAIIDTGTGACKGFGFAKFFEAADSEMCIRAFHRLGYEVGFARVSTIAPVANCDCSLTI